MGTPLYDRIALKMRRASFCTAGFLRGEIADTVSKLCDQGHLTQAVEALGLSVQTATCISKSLYYGVLKRCATEKNLILGRRVHAFTVIMGYQSDKFLCNHILRMYAFHGKLKDAMDVFTGVAEADAFMWSSIISAHVKQGHDKEAIKLYHGMQRSNVKPDGHVFVAALQACARALDLKTGQQVHALVLTSAVELDPFLCTCLVNMYAKCGRLEDAHRVFDGLRQKHVVTWTALIAGYSQHGMGQEALHLYSAMQQEGLVVPDSVTFACLLQACASVGSSALNVGKQLHMQMREQGHQADAHIASSLVNMYAKCGSLDDAHRVFDGHGQKDAVTWNSLIGAYSQQGMGWEALRLYSVMREEGTAVPDSVTVVCLLQACASLGPPALEKGKQLHNQFRCQIDRGDALVASSLVNMYAKCGSLEDAHRIFDGLIAKEVVTWTVLIAAYSQQGRSQEALDLYGSMQKGGVVVPDAVTFVCLLQACATLGSKALDTGRQLYVQIGECGLQADVLVANSLAAMFAKCGSMDEAQRVFDGLDRKEVATWNAMIAGYAQQGMTQEALRLYSAMQGVGAVPDSVTFVCLLQACADMGTAALEQGKQLHAHIEERGHQADAFVANSLVNMYAKCGNLEDAQKVFDGLGQKDVVTWTSLIAGYSQQGMGQEALSVYSAMEEESTAKPNSITFVCLLQACASVGTPAWRKGKDLHMQIKLQGYEADVTVANSLVNMYARCGSLEHARKVFDELGQRDVVTWTSLIAGYCEQGMEEEALRLYSAMQEEGLAVPNSVTFVSLLRACASLGSPALAKGKQLHAQIRERGYLADVFAANRLIDMYAKCGSLEDARRVFDGVSQKDVVTWTAMIAGFSNQGMGNEALQLYSVMQDEGVAEPNSWTYVCLLQACASVGSSALERGKQLHAKLTQREHESDDFVASSLVNMYAKCGGLGDAQKVFDKLHHKDVVTWNALIAGYSQQGMGQEALRLYSIMKDVGFPAPDPVTFICALQACAGLGTLALDTGKQLHEEIGKRGHDTDAFVANSLLNMYAKCGSLEDAQRIFDALGQKDVVAWNAMIAGYSQQGMGQEALHLYSLMEEGGVTAPDSVTFVCLLQACASIGSSALRKGRQIHGQIREHELQADLCVANSLMNMYAKCGSIEDAQIVFDGLKERDVVTWTTLIAGYSQQGVGQEALQVYRAMEEEGIAVPDAVTFACLLQACANVAALQVGRQLHAQIEETGLQCDTVVASSLVNVYGKCGSMADAQQVFDALPERGIVPWNALIAGYTSKGDSQAVFALVQKMRLDGIQPLGITFLSVLTVCSHAGLVDRGKEYFKVMSEHDGITPTVEHYTCMVDLLGRAGRLEEALDIVRTMRVAANSAVWHTLLSVCRKWSNVEVGRYAFEEAVKLERADAAAYLLMANIYTDAQMWEQEQKMRAARVRIRAWKQPGQSWWTDMEGKVHSFLVGDEKHPRVR